MKGIMIPDLIFFINKVKSRKHQIIYMIDENDDFNYGSSWITTLVNKSNIAKTVAESANFNTKSISIHVIKSN